jgi:hypothetical protein
MRDYLLLLHYYIFSLIQYTTFNFSTVAGVAQSVKCLTTDWTTEFRSPA